MFTSTKLIELRNPDINGNLRNPLLVFVPNELRTSSEDSFGVATFEDVRVGDVYTEINQIVLGTIPLGLRGSILSVLDRITQNAWKWASPIAITRFLLTVKVNDCDPDVWERRYTNWD